MTTNLAALIPSEKTALEIRQVEAYTPKANEILVKNTIIAFNPVESKIAKLAIFPLQYPAVIGFSYGGSVEAIGSQIVDFKVGDKVAVMRESASQGNQFGAFQRFVIATASSAIKLPENVNVDDATSVILNLSTVLGALSLVGGLDKPSVDDIPSKNGKKVLIYGGSSSIGSLAIQYARTAGYSVVSTSSPRNMPFVSTLGAMQIIDHTLSKDDLISALKTEGPYNTVLDSISKPETVSIVAAVLGAQGGGKLLAVLPPLGPEIIPENVERIMQPYGHLQEYPKHAEDNAWFKQYLPRGIAAGKVIPIPLQKIKGGLKGINEALDLLHTGTSGVKLVVDPWED
jgi:NADPH:quinone reductase-like Zn-dependent oxidoreductase